MSRDRTDGSTASPTNSVPARVLAPPKGWMNQLPQVARPPWYLARSTRPCRAGEISRAAKLGRMRGVGMRKLLFRAISHSGCYLPHPEERSAGPRLEGGATAMSIPPKGGDYPARIETHRLAALLRVRWWVRPSLLPVRGRRRIDARRLGGG